MKNLSLISLLALCVFASSAAAQQKPNIVVILAEDLVYGDVTFNRCPDYQTPKRY